MNMEKCPNQAKACLRKRAEKQILADRGRLGAEPTPAEARRLLHELQVHQIELEMQNEELQWSQLELEAARTRYFDLYDLAPVGYLSLDAEGVILESNFTAATLLGVARSVLVKKPLLRYILPEDRDSYNHFRQRFLTEAEARMCELRLLRADGVRLWVQLRIGPGQPGECRITLSDISAHRRIEDELNRDKRFLQALSDSRWASLRANDEAAYLNEVCRIVVEDCGFPMVWIGFAMTDAARTVRPMAQAGLGRDYLEAARITWDDSELGRGPTGTAIRTGRVAGCRNMLTDPSFAPWREEAVKRGYASSLVLPLLGEGGVFGALTIYSPVPEGFSEVETEMLTKLAEDLAYGIAALRERTARAKAEAALRRNEAQLEEVNRELERSNDDLQQFAHIASHDLQGPLHTVASFLQLLERGYRGRLDDKADTYIDCALEGIIYVQQLLGDLLNFSRVGGGELKLRPVHLGEIVERIAFNLQKDIAEHEAEVLVAGELPVVTVDESQILHLLQNLIANALKFRGEMPPRVETFAVRREGEWVICVRDNGIGIDSRFAERIFQIFRRLHKRDKYEGTGIGLAICKKIVERHGGRIWVESDPGRGGGPTFCFSLPSKREGSDVVD